MNYSIKAALLSGLIFPGLGQLLLKYYKTGFSLLVIAFICMATVVTQAVSKALSIVDQIQQDGNLPDAASIAESVNRASQGYDGHLVNLSMTGLVLCWLFGVIHAFIAGRRRDAEQKDIDQQQ